MAHKVYPAVPLNTRVKAKDLPKGQLGKVDDRLYVFHDNQGLLIRVWVGLQDNHTNVEVLDKTHRANDEWEVEVLPKGTRLELNF